MRRGALLLEILLSLAIFVSVGLAVGGALSRSAAAMLRAQERTLAADLAWSAVARIEAGEYTPQALNGPVEGDPAWELAIETTPTEHAGLVLLAVWARPTGAEGGGYTARHLVALRDVGQPALDDGWTGDPSGASPFGEVAP